MPVPVAPSRTIVRSAATSSRGGRRIPPILPTPRRLQASKCRHLLTPPPSNPRKISPCAPAQKVPAPPAQQKLRHTRAKRSVIPALAAGISPRRAPSPVPTSHTSLRRPHAKSPHHPRAKSSVIPARRDPSYPRLPRVSRRTEHQAPSQPPTPPSATPTQKVPAAPAQKVPATPAQQQIRHPHGKRGHDGSPNAP